MWQKIKALKEEAGKIRVQAESIIKRAEDERRDLTDDESRQCDELREQHQAKNRELEALERRHSFADPSALRDIKPIFEQRDLKGYSLLRAIRAKANGKNLDGIEREVNDEIARRNGKDAQGFYIPSELPLETRDLTLTTGAGAKPTITPATLIELIRVKTVINQLGVTTLTGMTGDFSIPKHTAASAAYWVTEGNAPTESNQTVGQVALAPKTVGAFTDISRKFMIQSSVSAEQFVRNDLATVLGIEIDRAALNGSGGGAEPTGVLNAAGTSTVAIATDGDAPTWAKLVEMETAVGNNNADIGSLAYVTNTKVRGKAKVTPVVSGQPVFLWANDNTINGYAAYATNQIPSNLTKGTGTNLSAAIFGNWADLLISYWSGIDIIVDPYTASTTGAVRVVALQDLDIKLRHAESFAKIVDIVTA